MIQRNPENCMLYSRKRLGFLFAFIILFASDIYSQQITDPATPKINIPTSPEAALLGRFGDIPVGYYTGTADISVPFYTVKEGAVLLPIQLSYHSSGIRVEDQATWVGLGWDLSPEGTIIQEVRGKSDEVDFGINPCDQFYNQFYQRFAQVEDNSYWFLPQWGRKKAPNQCLSYFISDPGPPPPWNNGYEDPECILDNLLAGGGEPDIYHYSFAGHSGKFYIHPASHEIVVIEKNDQLYFEKVNDNCFKATTLDGTVFTFADIETADGGIQLEYTGKTYKLSNVILLNGSRVDFSYTTYTHTESQFSESADVNRFEQGPAVSSKSTQTTHHSKALTSIISTDAIINFNLGDRDDINLFSSDNVKRLNSIDIISRETGKKIKSLLFSYSYFPYDFTGVTADAFVYAHADALGKRLRLDAAQEIGYDENETPKTDHPAYHFAYEQGITMPLKNSFAKDFWGYYNGKPNTRLLPNLDYFDYFYKEEYKVINQTLAYPYVGADRYTDNSYAGANLLKKVTYPTGGYTEFEYEPNSFTNQFIPDASKNVHKSYDVQDNSLGGTTSTLFKLSKATTIHFENHINNGLGNYSSVTPLTYDQMAGCYISFSKIKLVNGSPQVTLIKQWDLSTVLAADFNANGGKTWTEDVRVEFDPDPNPAFNYQIKVVFPDELNNPLFATIAGTTCHITYYDDTNVDISESNQCGMRVKAIKNYTAIGMLANHKMLKYYEGKLLNLFHPLTMYKANSLTNAYVTNGIGVEQISFYKKITASGTDFGVSGGNLIGYGKVEEIQLANNVATSGRKTFYYMNQENRTHQDCPNNPIKTNGLLWKEETYDNSGNKLLEKTNNYTPQQPFPPKYVAMRIVRLATGPKVSCANEHNFLPDGTWINYYEGNGIYNASQYGYNAYTIDAEWWKLSGTTTKLYNGANFLTTSEVITYNSEGSIQTHITDNSKNESLITSYYYPQDYPGDLFYNNLVVNHITGTPVVVEQNKKDRNNSTTLLTKQTTTYATFPNVPFVLPKYVYFKTRNNADQLKHTIVSYDDKANITEYIPENGIPVSIVWNQDKTLPVAKIQNANYASLLALPNGLNSDFRAALPNAQVMTYTYKPLVGMTSQTDPSGHTTYYEYDSFGRLSVVRDQNNKILKKYCYNYAGQPENCSN